MPTFKGRLSGGERAQSEPVAATVEGDRILIAGNGPEPIVWALSDLRPAAPIQAGDGDVLLGNKRFPRMTLFLEGEGVGALFIARAPRLSPSFQRMRLVRSGVIAAVIIVALGVAVFFSGFSVSSFVAGLIPFKSASRLGEQSTYIFRKIAPPCGTEAGIAALKKMLARLSDDGRYGDVFTLHVGRTKTPNAFALPGRHIVMLTGLISQAKSAEEVAGVLAHEMGHGIERHPEAMLVRAIGLQAVVTLFTGGGSDRNPAALGAVFAQLRYSRDAERQADAHAIEILRNAKVSNRPLAEFFSRHPGGSAGYLSTHPASEERAKLILAEPDVSGPPILSEQEWADLRVICPAAKE